MRRARGFLINSALAAASLLLVYGVLQAADYAAGRYVLAHAWPGPMGLMFMPGGDEDYDTFDFKITERINSLGFRDREVPLHKTCKYRILAIGDSFTYGWGVNLEDAWCKVLERNLRAKGMDVEVLNFGRPATGPDDYAYMAESAIPILQPDMVLVGCLSGDDLQQPPQYTDPVRIGRTYFPNLVRLFQYWRFSSGRTKPWKVPKRSAADNQKSWSENARNEVSGMSPDERARYDKLEETVRKAFMEGRLNPWMISHSTGSPEYFMNTLNPDGMEWQIGNTARGFKRVAQAARGGGAKAMVLGLPEGFYVNREAFRNVQRIGFHVVPEMLNCECADEAVRRACARAGLPFHSVLAGFREHIDEKGLYLELDRHMAAAGNALFANLVTPIVAKEIGDAAMPVKEAGHAR